jgi:curved DNA-binding protein
VAFWGTERRRKPISTKRDYLVKRYEKRRANEQPTGGEALRQITWSKVCIRQGQAYIEVVKGIPAGSELWDVLIFLRDFITKYSLRGRNCCPDDLAAANLAWWGSKQMKDLYKILGVNKTATEDEIKKAYRALAKELHPDRNPGNKKAEDKFKEVTVAHEVLSNAEKRKLYDEFGADSLRPGFDPNIARAARSGRFTGVPFGQGFGGQGANFGGDVDLSAIFEQMFGGRGFSNFGGGGFQSPPRQRPPQQGENAEHTISIELEEAIKGGDHHLQLQKQTGEVNQLKVKIPAGVTDGDKIRLGGQGLPGAFGGPPGDLILQIQIAPHRLYKVQGKDLSIDIPLTLPEAILGTSIEVPTPEGNVKLKIPAGAQSGKKLRLTGKGLQDRKSNSKGDLYVVLQIQAPDASNPKVKELAQALAPFYGDVRAHLFEK